MNAQIEVIKVGGSLLTWEAFPRTFRQWFDATKGETSPGIRLVVPGGGRLVDQIRDLDLRFGIRPETAHWAAVAAMDLHADFFGEWLDGIVVEANELELDSHRGGITSSDRQVSQPIILRMSRWLQTHQKQVPLPQTWATTSDAIAAAFAESVHATRFTLLKSCPIDNPSDFFGWASAGLVDDVFPSIAARLPDVRWVCLNNEKSPAA